MNVILYSTVSIVNDYDIMEKLGYYCTIIIF